MIAIVVSNVDADIWVYIRVWNNRSQTMESLLHIQV